MITESIFDGQTTIIPMADVQHVEKHWFGTGERTKDNYAGIKIITRHTKYNMEADCWENNIYLDRTEADLFLKTWCVYRSEFEDIENHTCHRCENVSDQLMDWITSENESLLGLSD